MGFFESPGMGIGDLGSSKIPSEKFLNLGILANTYIPGIWDLLGIFYPRDFWEIGIFWGWEFFFVGLDIPPKSHLSL